MNETANSAGRSSKVAPVSMAGLVGCVALLPLMGCSAKVSRFEIIDHRGREGDQAYHETFAEGFYTIWPDGNLDLVLRRTNPIQADPTQQLTQIIHLKTLWRSIPGTTVAHRTQINGKVCYLIITGNNGATFEGAGSIFFEEDRKRERIEGSLDLALLKPTRRLAAGGLFFKHAQLQGKFVAVRDRRRLVRTVNEMDRLFGPLPPIAVDVSTFSP